MIAPSYLPGHQHCQLPKLPLHPWKAQQCSACCGCEDQRASQPLHSPATGHPAQQHRGEWEKAGKPICLVHSWAGTRCISHIKKGSVLHMVLTLSETNYVVPARKH